MKTVQTAHAKIIIDNAEALEKIKEVTQAANECMEALEKLEGVMNRLTGAAYKPPINIDVEMLKKEFEKI